MKRLSKKLIALVMAMTMVLAMGVTAFANEVPTSNTVTVTVKIKNPNITEESPQEYLYNDSVTVNKNASLYTLTDATTIENYGTATAMDAIIDAADTISYHKVQYLDTETWEPIDQYGIAIDSINNHAGTSTSNADGTTTYRYWELKINGSPADNYATNYVLTNGMIIEMDWSEFTY